MSRTWITALMVGFTVMIHSGLEAPALAQAEDVLFEDVTLSPNFFPTPVQIRGVSGGDLPAEKVAGQTKTPTGLCVGYVDAKPDHTLRLTGFFNYLKLEVRSPQQQDTTLVIRGPGGTWCNDDFRGKNAGISGQWQSGDYQIWVGSYQESAYYPYVIRITNQQ